MSLVNYLVIQIQITAYISVIIYDAIVHAGVFIDDHVVSNDAVGADQGLALESAVIANHYGRIQFAAVGVYYIETQKSVLLICVARQDIVFIPCLQDVHAELIIVFDRCNVLDFKAIRCTVLLDISLAQFFSRCEIDHAFAITAAKPLILLEMVYQMFAVI